MTVSPRLNAKESHSRSLHSCVTVLVHQPRIRTVCIRYLDISTNNRSLENHPAIESCFYPCMPSICNHVSSLDMFLLTCVRVLLHHRSWVIFSLASHCHKTKRVLGDNRLDTFVGDKREHSIYQCTFISFATSDFYGWSCVPCFSRCFSSPFSSRHKNTIQAPLSLSIVVFIRWKLCTKKSGNDQKRK